MAQITAASVKSLREQTGLPMMDCKRALQETNGDQQAAVDWLRKQGAKVMGRRADRETSEGRVAVYVDMDAGVGSMVELLCESAPSANSQEFRELANDVALQLATGRGAKDADALLQQPSPDQSGKTLAQRFEDVQNQIREVFRLARIVRVDSRCGGYAHHTGTSGVLVEVEGGTPEVAKDVCMHITAMRPSALVKEDLDPALVERERAILTEVAKSEGKPDNIIEKMVEGRLRNFYAQHVLTEQPFVKDEKQTVGKLAAGAGMKLLRFVHWELGKQ